MLRILWPNPVTEKRSKRQLFYCKWIILVSQPGNEGLYSVNSCLSDPGERLHDWAIMTSSITVIILSQLIQLQPAAPSTALITAPFSLSPRWESAATDTACAPMNTLKWVCGKYVNLPVPVSASIFLLDVSGMDVLIFF